MESENGTPILESVRVGQHSRDSARKSIPEKVAKDLAERERLESERKQLARRQVELEIQLKEHKEHKSKVQREVVLKGVPKDQAIRATMQAEEDYQKQKKDLTSALELTRAKIMETKDRQKAVNKRIRKAPNYNEREHLGRSRSAMQLDHIERLLVRLCENEGIDAN